MRLLRDAYKACIHGVLKVGGLAILLNALIAPPAEGKNTYLFLQRDWPVNAKGRLSREQAPPPLAPAPKQESGASVDPSEHRAWHLESIGVYAAWASGEGDMATRIAVLDAGVDYNHPELAPRLVRSSGEIAGNGVDDDGNGLIDDVIGWDWLRNHGLPWDSNGQGSAWAALAVATRGNGRGSVGVCPGCGLIVERVFSDAGEANMRIFEQAIKDAHRRGASVLVTGLATPVPDRQLLNMFEFAANQDMVVVLAAGNQSADLDQIPLYPQAFSLRNALVVAAAKYSRGPTSSTSYGARTVDLAAPGEDLVTGLGGAADRWNGAGTAAALVAGAVALVRSQAPQLNAETVVNIVKATTSRFGAWKGRSSTEGLLNVSDAVDCATSKGLWCLQ